MTSPNFFIVGAPKCGTTSLSSYLREHPNIFMCTPKEPHFFSTDFKQYQFVDSFNDYHKLFEEADDNHHIIGEASATYLYSENAIPLIKKFNPKAKLIVMLRNPPEMLYSMHSQLLSTCDENEPDFEKAFLSIPERKNGENVPKKCRDRKLLYYDEMGKFGEQVERLMHSFPKEQILFIFTEDFFSDPETVYLKVLDFLGISSDNRKSFPKLNPNKQHKYSLIKHFIRYPPKNLVPMAMKLKEVLGLKKLGFIATLRRYNLSETQRPKLDSEFHKKLTNIFREDIKKLSQLTGRNLDNWLNSD